MLEKRLRDQAFLNGGIKITLIDERDDEITEQVMHLSLIHISEPTRP